MVIEFLTQLHIVLKAYFGDVTESVLQVRSPPSVARGLVSRADSLPVSLLLCDVPDPRHSPLSTLPPPIRLRRSTT